MEIMFESTKDFEKELTTFSKSERATIINHINRYAQLFLTDKPALFRRLHRLYKANLINDYESTLYSFRVSNSIRIILTVDEDPIFDQVIFTLFRVVRKPFALQAYDEIAESIYADFLAKEKQISVSMSRD